MSLHPSYLASFHPDKGGAIHEQFVTDTRDLDAEGLARGGLTLVGQEPVYKFTGGMFWYRPGPFRGLCAGARDSRYRALEFLLEPGPPGSRR